MKHHTSAAVRKKATAQRRSRAAVFFPDHAVYERIERLCKLMEAELPIRMSVPGHVAVMQAISEAIERREKEK